MPYGSPKTVKCLGMFIRHERFVHGHWRGPVWGPLVLFVGVQAVKSFSSARRRVTRVPWHHGRGKPAVRAVVGTRKRRRAGDAGFWRNDNTPESGIPETDPGGAGELAPSDPEAAPAERVFYGDLPGTTVARGALHGAAAQAVAPEVNPARNRWRGWHGFYGGRNGPHIRGSGLVRPRHGRFERMLCSVPESGLPQEPVLRRGQRKQLFVATQHGVLPNHDVQEFSKFQSSGYTEQFGMSGVGAVRLRRFLRRHVHPVLDDQLRTAGHILPGSNKRKLPEWRTERPSN